MSGIIRHKKKKNIYIYIYIYTHKRGILCKGQYVEVNKYILWRQQFSSTLFTEGKDP
jgi:hypothetical protein